MSTIENYKKLPKNVSTENDLDFAFLRKTGIAYIESMGGGLWSDLNDHDPGVTMLEMLAYAITDLGARMDLPIETLLASEDDPELRKQFYRAEEILPSCPVNELDYRKLFIDIDGVRNCWMVKRDVTMYVDCVNGELSYQPFPDTILEQTSYTLQGVNCLIVDYDDDANTATVDEFIRAAYEANRNLCEVLAEIKPIEEKPISICADVELERSADENVVHAKIIDAIEQYFATEIRRYSLKEMKEKGYRMDEIFEGPLLENGFIDTEELKKAELRSEVRLSDIINLIMDIDGIISISSIQIKCCCGDKEEGSDWLICIDPEFKPVMAPTEGEGVGDCELKSVFNYKKDVLPVRYDPSLAQNALDAIRAERAAQNDLALIDQFPEIPVGDVLNIEETTTIMNDFPEAYGIGPYGLPGTVPESRRAQAKQLKGYLLFFDQILATYFAHLGKVKDLFAMDAGNAPTYFTQAIQDVRGFEELVKDYPINDDPLLSEKLLELLDDKIGRRNEILDHLIARFAENFSDYAFLVMEMYDSGAEEMLISNKEQFLAEYVQLSKRRGKGYNVKGPVWDTENVSGLQHRVSRLSGIADYSRRDLVDHSTEEWITFLNPDYSFGVRDASDAILFKATDTYDTSCQAIQARIRTISFIQPIDVADVQAAFTDPITDGQLISNVRLNDLTGGEFSYSIVDGTTELATSGIKTSEAELEQSLIDAITYLNTEAAIDRYSAPIPEEGIFLVEHLLLLPSGTAVAEAAADPSIVDPFLPICIDDCDDTCGVDPYSFRASVVLPGTADRFDNADFRNFMDLLIRQEMPSHVLPRICWIDPCQLDEFQTRYQEYLDAKNLGDVPVATLNAFLEIFNKLQNIYPGGRLYDCDTIDLSGRFILGRSNI